jgi:hypothetical protein
MKIKIVAIVEAVVIIILAVIIFNYHNVNQAMATRISHLVDDVITLNDNISDLETRLKATLPYVEARGEQIKLVNQSNVHNPTWDELKIFLLKDDTDRLRYVEKKFTCGDFAKRLHDNSELAGIRAGIVAIEFQGGMLHAANVFNTTDKGIVYIDDTSGDFPWENYDKVGYIEIGKWYGVLNIKNATSFSYSYYEDIVNKWEVYTKDRLAYEDSGIKYSLNLREMDLAQEWENRLNLENAGIPYWIDQTFATVRSFEVYW